jgi:hypothetical protein
MPRADSALAGPNRLSLEIGLLRQTFRRVSTGRSAAGEDTFDIPLRTNRGNAYTLRLVAGPRYPDVIPRAYLVAPHDLRDARGTRLTDLGVSVSMHLLSPEGANPQICHDHPGRWNASQTLYKVAVKVRVWLEMYEAHLENGLPLDTWLSHVENP